MKLLSTDSNLGTEPELGSVCERGRRIGIDRRRIDTEKKFFDGPFVFCHYGLAVFGTVGLDVLKRLIKRINRADAHLVVEELNTIVLRLCGVEQVGWID